jgi:hypothetical protein
MGTNGRRALGKKQLLGTVPRAAVIIREACPSAGGERMIQ